MARSKEEIQKWKEELIRNAEEKLLAITTTEDFKHYLKIMASLPKYSLNNLNLIYSQKENATHVMGYKAWQELDRHVNKGAKAIHIVAPIVAKLTKEEKERLKTDEDYGVKGYRTIPVFDVSDTSGKELKYANDFIKSDYTTEETEIFAELEIKEVVKLIESKYQVPISFEKINDENVKGYYFPKDHSITISSELTKTEQLKTLFHEFAHSQLHNKKAMQEYPELLSKPHKEAQAESVAFLTMSALNIDTSNYSVGYVSTWARDINLMKQALKEIKTVFDQTFDIATTAKEKVLKQLENQENQTNENEKELFIRFDFSENNSIRENLEKGQLVPYDKFVEKLYLENELLLNNDYGYDKVYFDIVDEKGNDLIYGIRYDVGSETYSLSEFMDKDIPDDYKHIAKQSDEKALKKVSSVLSNDLTKKNSNDESVEITSDEVQKKLDDYTKENKVSIPKLKNNNLSL